MPEFSYVGVNRAGKKVEGKVSVDTEGDLRMLLRSQGVRPTKIQKVNLLQRDLGKIIGGKSSTKLRLEELAVLTRQLQVLIESGVPLVQSLEVLGEQANTSGMQALLFGIKDRVSSGNFLWESLSAYPATFPKLYISLVRAGESSGSLDIVLKRLSRYLEDTARLVKTLKSASIYPIIVLTLGLGVTSGMLLFVVPKFEEMLKSNGAQLPWITQTLMDLSHWMSNNMLMIFGGLGGGIFLLHRYLNTDEGRAQFQKAVFNAPVFGIIIQKGAMARFSRTLQTLLSSGVNLLDAIDICRETVDNVVLEEAILQIRNQISAGKTLGAITSAQKVIPKMASQMIVVGETTGNLDKMLDKIAEFYEEDVETAVAGLSKLIEPALIVILGVMVGGTLLAVYLPMFQSGGAIN